MQQLQVFKNPDHPEFGNVRTIEQNGEVWFVGIDVATALGYSKAGEAVKTNVSDEDTALMGVLDSNGHTQQTKVINESGLYSLIFGSRLESAKEFKKWVTGEVLPSIRKTGGYQSGQSIPHTYREQLLLVMAANEEVNARVDNVETEISTIKNDFSAFRDDLPLFPKELEAINKAVKAKGMDIVHGKDSPAYRSCYKKVVRDIYSMLWREFDCSSYKDIPRCYLGMVPGMIEKYEAPFVLLNAIRESNEEVK